MATDDITKRKKYEISSVGIFIVEIGSGSARLFSLSDLFYNGATF